MLEHLPPGFSMDVYYPINVDFSFNDVRRNPNATLEFWFETALKVASDKVSSRRIAEVILHNPHWMSYGRWHENTWQLPADRESVLWYTLALPMSGRLQHAWAHQHQRWSVKAFVFASDPTTLGLLQFEGGLYNLTSNLDIPHALVMQVLIPHMSGPAGTLVCSTAPVGRRLEFSSFDTAEFTPDFLGTKSGTYFDRNAPMTCSSLHFSAGDIMTAISFNGPAYPSLASHTIQHNHAIFHILYLPDQHSPSSIMLLGSHRPDFTWQGHMFDSPPDGHVGPIPWGVDQTSDASEFQ